MKDHARENSLQRLVEYREAAIYARAAPRRRELRRHESGHVLELRRLIGVMQELSYLSRDLSTASLSLPSGVALVARCSVRVSRGVAQNFMRGRWGVKRFSK